MKFKSYFYFLLAFPLLVFFTERFLAVGQAPWLSRGYDFGFYLFELRHPAGGSWFFSLAGLSGSYTSPLFLLNRLLNLQPTTYLLALTIGCGLAMMAVWFYYFRENRQAAIIAALLTAVSTAYQEASYLALFKTLVALPIVVLGLGFLKNKRWRWFAVTSVLLIALHRTSAIFFLLAAAAYLVYFQILTKKFKILLLEILGGGAAAFFAWHYFYGQEIINKIFTAHNPYAREGIFLGAYGLWGVLWPFWVLAIIGAFFYIKNKQHPMPVILAAITVVWIIFQLPFYRRAVIYLDLACTIFIAYVLSVPLLASYRTVLERRINRGNLIKYIFAMIIIACLGFYTFRYLSHEPPLVTAAQVNEIKNFQTKNPGDFVLAVDANDAPWLLGFLRDSRLAGPGLFEDRSTYQEWNGFWTGKNQTQFLWRYPRPLYIYQNRYIIPGPIADCFVPISERFSEYVCKN